MQIILKSTGVFLERGGDHASLDWVLVSAETVLSQFFTKILPRALSGEAESGQTAEGTFWPEQRLRGCCCPAEPRAGVPVAAGAGMILPLHPVCSHPSLAPYNPV